MIVDENDLSEEDEVLVPPSKRIKKKENDNNVKEEKKSSISLLLQDDEDDDEEDAPLPGSSTTIMTDSTSSVQVASQEFTDSLNAIQIDCWDIFSWITYIEEVEQNNGGSVTITEAYAKFLNQFKKATKFWKTILDYHIKNSSWALAEDLFNKCLLKCRNVEIWKSYLTMVRKRTIDTIPKPNDQYLAAERKRFENAFEKALENIGYSCDSEEIWRLYIDFIREGSDSNIQSGGYDKKLVPLRKIYQRALCIPMEGLDIFWKEYETLERTAGGDNQHLADKVLPEFNEKYLHAKTIYKDRKRYTSKISFDRLATPPSKNLADLQQLDIWNKWIRFEMTNPDNLSIDVHRQYIEMIYDQCLCCFSLHPEIWMSLARFHHQYSGISEARNVYREAIEILPDSIFLRVSLSELEESCNNIELAKEILYSAFDKIPCSLTFSVLQRYLRRNDGILSARKLFSDTLPIRNEYNLGLEIYISNAQLELEMNCKPDIAKKVLELLKEAHPLCIKDIRYVHIMSKVLLRMGDLKQLQWLYQVALGEDASSLAAPDAAFSTSLDKTNAILAGGSGYTTITSGIPEILSNEQAIASDRPIKELVQLWEDYLQVETILGQSDINRMNELRIRRDKARSQLDELCRSRNTKLGILGMDGNGEKEKISDRTKIFGLFEGPYELGERYDNILCSLPKEDEGLKERSKGRTLLEEVQKQENDRMIALRDAGLRNKNKKDFTKSIDGKEDSIDTHLSGVPALLREFLSKLPIHTTQLPDFTGFIRNMRNIVLPPRPAIVAQDSGAAASSWLTASLSSSVVDDDDDDNDNDEADELMFARDDIFRRRKRAKLGI